LGITWKGEKQVKETIFNPQSQVGKCSSRSFHHIRNYILVCILIFLTLFLFSTNVRANEPWDHYDKFMFMNFLALSVVDWGQTVDISKRPNEYYEKYNFILKGHPPTWKTHAYFATSILANYLIVDILPKKLRKVWLGGGIALELFMTANNASIGLNMRF